MRTTLTVTDATDQRLRQIAQEQNRQYKDVINDALALGLAQMEVTEATPAYRVAPLDAGMREGVDRTKLNQMLDELADDSADASGHTSVHTSADVPRPS